MDEERHAGTYRPRWDHLVPSVPTDRVRSARISPHPSALVLVTTPLSQTFLAALSFAQRLVLHCCARVCTDCRPCARSGPRRSIRRASSQSRWPSNPTVILIGLNPQTSIILVNSGEVACPLLSEVRAQTMQVRLTRQRRIHASSHALNLGSTRRPRSSPPLPSVPLSASLLCQDGGPRFLMPRCALLHAALPVEACQVSRAQLCPVNVEARIGCVVAMLVYLLVAVVAGGIDAERWLSLSWIVVLKEQSMVCCLKGRALCDNPKLLARE